MHKLRFIAHKELRHILRDPRSLIIAILMPILMTLLYGYAINLDIKNIKLAVIDFDRTSASTDLIGRFYNSGYFSKATGPVSIDNPEMILKKGQANAVLIIRPGLSEAIQKLKNIRNRAGLAIDKYELGLIVDGADANMAAAAGSYSSIIVSQVIKDNLPPGFELPGIKISRQVLYNPDLKSSHFFVPGLIAIILMMISALLTSVTVAREKESGTMEQLLTTPVTPRQIIIGKTLPYVGLALLDGILVLVFGVFHFGVPFTGSVLLLFAFGVIYVISALAIGIFISTVVKTQQLAMMGAMMVTVLPSVMLSGFIFEIKNMPLILQIITHIVPARYFLLIIRGIMLKGSGLELLWVEASFLILMSILLLSVATKKFKLRVG
ncbi:MAG: ABC transporter permease [Candidatus Zixiibacteriota bacterium]|nr:MAG: ABC transporter permease [candidate division Zixibacteria bacterium]HHI03044.1 ABC transporter permease [candidate division Zixibacteria bacterium]